MIAHAGADLSCEELSNLALQHKVYTTQIRAEMECKAASDRKRAIGADQQSHDTDSSNVEEHVKTGVHIEDEDYVELSPPAVLPGHYFCHNKGNGANLGNWGDVSFLENFMKH
ncbi:hypothetical protein DFH08DRAFT_967275 [Mycena albidolilacea]|uniref:Uncharacterized protein n=1 Tax=Mycena albidolilacea TaxID=1033008 RepID=A0AAD6ZMK1_9AGAR|nr:hypothetical protein DFH08DRAFT_967275 [Mycena albidolilacea]